MAKDFSDIHNIISATARDYQYNEMFSLPSWLAAFWQQIQNFVQYCLVVFLSILPKTVIANGNTGIILVIALLVVALLSVVMLIIYRYKHPVKFGTLNSATTDGALPAEPHTAEEWRQQAFLYQKEEQWRDACRALHRSGLQLLDEANILPFLPARSNFEYAIALSTKPGLKAIFRTFSNRVDAIYFGNRKADESDFQFCLQSLQKIQAAIAGNNEIILS